MQSTHGCRAETWSARTRWMASPATTRNCRGCAPGASLTTTLATVRSTEVLGPILVDLRWKMRTPGVVATSQRFCQRRKLSTQTLT